jgi:hypothetical protein
LKIEGEESMKQSTRSLKNKNNKKIPKIQEHEGNKYMRFDYLFARSPLYPTNQQNKS